MRGSVIHAVLAFHGATESVHGCLGHWEAMTFALGHVNSTGSTARAVNVTPSGNRNDEMTGVMGRYVVSNETATMQPTFSVGHAEVRLASL
jgi:hypothetical protein